MALSLHTQYYLKRTAKLLGICAATGMCLVGGLHHPRAMGLLRAIGGCPVSVVSAQEVERAQRQAMQTEVRLALPAPSRGLFGFVLGDATLAQAEQWAEREHVSCVVKRERSVFQCTNVTAGTILDELTFTFDTRNGRLRDLSGYEFRLGPETARAQMQKRRALTLATWGAPHEQAGDWALPAAGHYETATMRYRFADLSVDVTASALPQGTTVQVRAGLYEE